MEGSIPYCQECNKKFSQHNNLKQHINTMHGGTRNGKRKQVYNPIVSSKKAAKTAWDKCEKYLETLTI